jgi:hypothetical protein
VSVHYKHYGIATFDATTEKIFRYMSTGNHHHAAFKSHRLVGTSDDVVTLEAEIYNPDGSTFVTTIQHRLDCPNGAETTMLGGAFDGASFVHTYTAIGERTRVDLEGEFPAFPGIAEADELAMIDGFFGPSPHGSKGGAMRRRAERQQLSRPCLHAGWRSSVHNRT